MNKRAMISQPMAGKTDEEIAETRDKAHAKLREMGYEFVNTLFTDEWYSDEGVLSRRGGGGFRFRQPSGGCRPH